MKQTAVEYMYSIMFEKKGRISKEEFEQAKAMEKEQLIIFGAQCMVEVEKESGLGAIRIYEQYYNETFKSE